MLRAPTSSTQSPDFSKIAFYAVAVAAAFGLTLGIGLYSGARQTAIYRTAFFVYSQVKEVWNERLTILKLRPENFLHAATHDGAGVTVNDVPNGQSDLLFISGFFKDTNELRLIRRDGQIVKRWPVSYLKTFPKRDFYPILPKSDWNVDIHGALALPDGSVVFNFDYAGLVKLDRCGKIVWTVKHPTHHSVRRSADGGFWVPGRDYVGKGDRPQAPFLTPPYEGDVLLKVSKDGSIVKSINVIDLFIKNDLMSILTTTGANNLAGLYRESSLRDVGHLNAIDELTKDLAKDFPMFAAGDLVVSLRDYNLVFVMDPESERIKWWRIGPWIRQHDPKFEPGGTISVFNNHTDFAGGRYFGGSQIVSIDPATDAYEILYGADPEQKIYTDYRGWQMMRPGGGLIFVESHAGRAVEVDAGRRIVWEFINRYDDDEVARLDEAIVYDRDYFDVTDWTCD